MPHNKGKTIGKADRAARNLSQLETELRHLQQGIGVTHISGNDHRGRLSPTAHAKKQIDKPKGQAGRSELKGGYSLQQAMGLAGNDRKYNVFRMMARKYTNRYLDTSRTLKQQDKLTVTFLLAYAQCKHQFLAKFRDNWPFHDFMGCYLRNHVQYTKKQHANLDDSEIEESDVNDSETDKERSPQPQKKLKFAHVSIPARAKPAPASCVKPAPHAQSAPHAQPAPHTKPAPKSKMTQIPAHRLDLPIPTSKSSPPTTHPDPLVPAAKPKPRPISSSDTRTTKVATETPPTAMAKPKAKPVSIPRTNRTKTKSKPAEASAAHLKIDTTINDDDDAYEFADLPLVCPNDRCKDLVPADPTIGLPIASESQPTAGPSKFSGSYDDAAYQDNGESELSEPPESIHATPVPRPKPSRARPARRRSCR
ncbi:hypothetical protein EV702DRAFT_1042386 [Suillus placidus]|uniref:Uncharacterized protein n=1 Tax=Suillus placidus TaxID=48579 RepID=A0A9P7D6H3_9AGAM|nr:hypothetical protein EV702DRAFT_1042386 [Suillus placidus]